MSTAGQAVGGIVGGIVGFFTPVGPIYGAQIGMMAGGYIDPPKGPNMQGPRLTDLSVQTSTYGAPIPRLYGTIATNGNVFWLENNKLKEVAKKSKSGGKGGGGSATTTNYTYFATFAVGLGRGPIFGIKRIWIGPKLIYDAGSSDLESVIASNEAINDFNIYLGTDDQEPDARMQATLGVANTPAYRGLAYIVVKDLALADYGNNLMAAQVKVEVISSATSSVALVDTEDKSMPQPHTAPNYAPRPFFVDSDRVVFYAPQWAGLTPSSGVDFHRYDRRAAGSWIKTFISGSKTGDPPPVGSTDNPSEFFRTGAEVFDPVKAGDFFPGYSNLIKRGGVAVGASSFSYGVGDNRLHIATGGPETTITTDDMEPLSASHYGEYVYAIGEYFIRKYDFNLQLINSVAVAWPAVYGKDARAFPGNNAIYFIPTPQDIDLYRIDPDTLDVTLIAQVAGDFRGEYNTEYAIDGDLLTIAYGKANGGTGYVRRYNIGIPSIDAVNLSDIISDECTSSNIIQTSDIDVTQIADTVRGYKVANIGAIRAALEPLQGAYPFDIVQSGYKIKFIPRGQSSVASIDESELDARGGETSSVRLTITNEMDTQLPRDVHLKYIDVTREYDINEQYAERLNTDSINSVSMDMPIVLNAEEAAGMAEVLLYMYWLERRDVKFSLPPDYRYLEPADVVTVTAASGVYELRLTGVHLLSNGILECTARFNSAATYIPAALGAEGQSTGAVISLSGFSKYVLIDGPTLSDALNVPGFIAAMTGYTDGWPGGVLYRSTDNGQVWVDLQAYTDKVPIGYAQDSIAAGRTDIIDTTSVLNVIMIKGEIESVSELTLLGGSNYYAYGDDGRWEIVGVKTSELNADGSYNCSDFLRGRLGTEWAMDTHQVGDYFISLNDSDLAFIAADVSTIDQTFLYRGITAGMALDSDSDYEFAYGGENLKPLSPIYINGNRHPTTNDWTLTWMRRTRIDWKWRDYVDAALGETAESYEIDIYDNSDYTTVLRTLTSSSETVSYTSANQVTDFGINKTTLYIKIYQISASIGRGRPMITSITR